MNAKEAYELARGPLITDKDIDNSIEMMAKHGKRADIFELWKLLDAESSKMRLESLGFEVKLENGYLKINW